MKRIYFGKYTRFGGAMPERALTGSNRKKVLEETIRTAQENRLKGHVAGFIVYNIEPDGQRRIWYIGSVDGGGTEVKKY